MNPFKTIIKTLEILSSNGRSINSDCANVFTHLIELLGEENFNLNFTQGADYHGDFDSFYYGYHKQFRQADMFNIEGAEYVGKKAYEKNKEKWDAKVDELDGHFAGAYMLFPIGGHLDMIFWSMIHIDAELWENSLKSTYEDYIEYKENLKSAV